MRDRFGVDVLTAPLRERLIAKLEKSLEPLPYIYAAWLEGADALGTIDTYSDIDLWLDVEDGREADAITAVRKWLKQVGTLELDHERDHPHPKIHQCFLRAQGMSKFCFVDLCVQSHSRTMTFTEGQDVLKVLFDKKNVIKFQAPPEFDVAARVKALSREFGVFQIWVEKALLRAQFLEALEAYQTYTLSPLVKLLRLRYAPLKYNYGLKHSYQDFPADVIGRLEPLYKVASLTELAQRYQKANAWFYEETANFS